MCGIVAYIGKKKTKEVLLQGLKKMEYRGYDSAGMLLVEENKTPHLIRSLGKIEKLEEKTASIPNVSYISGIAHTRWATHGGVFEHNTHPQFSQDKSIYLVHNGIIENHHSLKETLLKKGYTFSSETDTEVLVQLIHYFYQDSENNILLAVKKALKIAEGAFGIALIHLDTPEKIIVARNGSPLVIGVGKNEMFVASDPQAISAYTQQFIFLEDKQIASITQNDAEITTISSDNIIDKKIQELKLDLSSLEKGSFPHFMLKEIYEQPTSIKNTYEGKVDFKNEKIQISGLFLKNKQINQLERIVVTSCGSAYHASVFGKYLIEKIARISVDCEYASEFRYRHPVINPEHLFITVSQSGETADTLASIKLIKETGANIFAITNSVGSSISRESSGGIYIHAGHENGVAATKTFTSQIMAFILLALHLGKIRNTISPKQFNIILSKIQELPNQISLILKQVDHIKSIADKYSSASNAIFLGRDLNYPIALEGALKLKEISYIHAEGYPAAEMKHGPLALIDENMPSFIIATQDIVYKKTLSNIQEIKARKGKTIIIAHENDSEILALADDIITVPTTHEYLQPLLNTIPLQLLSYYIAVNRGLDVDRPRNLAKSVTVE